MKKEIPEQMPWFPWRYEMAAYGTDVSNMKVNVNHPVALLTYWYYYILQHLDKQIEDTSAFPIYCGGYADIYSGVWHGDWTAGKVTVGIIHIYITPHPDSWTLTCIKVTIQVFQDAHKGKYSQSSAEVWEGKYPHPFLTVPSSYLTQTTSCWTMNIMFGHFLPSKCASPIQLD